MEVRLESLGLNMLLTWKKDKASETEGERERNLVRRRDRVMSLRDDIEEKWLVRL